VILLLTGSIQGTRNKVTEFLNSFKKFSWLWTDSIQDNIKAFSKKNPTLQDYEDALKKFSNIEEEIEKIEVSHKIGAMELKTGNLCQGLR
jgi:dynein heavy chain